LKRWTKSKARRGKKKKEEVGGLLAAGDEDGGKKKRPGGATVGTGRKISGRTGRSWGGTFPKGPQFQRGSGNGPTQTRKKGRIRGRKVHTKKGQKRVGGGTGKGQYAEPSDKKGTNHQHQKHPKQGTKKTKIL